MKLAGHNLTGAVCLMAGLLIAGFSTRAQQPDPEVRDVDLGTEKNALLLTVFLRHDQSMTLDEINEHVERTGFRENFPPEGVGVVSWTVAMGIGQVIVLEVPPDKLRAVNVAIEKGAWGAYRTEFYPTYNLLPVIERLRGTPLDRATLD